jgi:hypothetical protein
MQVEQSGELGNPLAAGGALRAEVKYHGQKRKELPRKSMSNIAEDENRRCTVEVRTSLGRPFITRPVSSGDVPGNLVRLRQ